MTRISEVLEYTKDFVCGVDDAVHDFDHICAVLANAQRAILYSDLTEDEKEMILLASILHDVDDVKVFPNSKDYENAKYILRRFLPNDESMISIIITMIKLVSTRLNGNENYGVEEWMLYPRYADRLEATGDIGIQRARLYSYYIDRPLFSQETKRATTLEELWEIATEERFRNYVLGRNKELYPDTFIDHLYDKVVHLGKKELYKYIKNTYFIAEFERRQQVVVDYLLEFGRCGTL